MTESFDDYWRRLIGIPSKNVQLAWGLISASGESSSQDPKNKPDSFLPQKNALATTKSRALFGRLEEEEKKPDLQHKQHAADELSYCYYNRLYQEHTGVRVARKIADSIQNINDLRVEVERFDLCELKLGAKNTVFADGIYGAPIMLVGEGPGRQEDERGIPFCGPSGMLLEEMLNDCGISRTKNAYITNTVFWRPPMNRDPSELEVEICRPFLEKHISLASPKLLILVGSVAAKNILGPNMNISKIRKQFFSYQNCYMTSAIRCAALFHPAYILRQQSKKVEMLEDIRYIIANTSQGIVSI